MAISHRFVAGKPIIRSTGTTHYIEHKEFITTVTGSADFKGLTYPINPGLAVTFPWLATQANSWEMYRFRKLKFEYTGSIGTGVAGKAIAVPEYDPDDAPPDTLAQAYSAFGMTRCAVWDDMDLKFSPEVMHAVTPWKYVRSGLTPGSLGTYDVGTATIASNGAPSGANIGDFFVSYAVEFKVPQLGNTKPFVSSFLYSDYAMTSDMKYESGTGISLCHPDNTTTLIDQLGLGPPLQHGTYQNGTPAFGWQLLKLGCYSIRIYIAVRSNIGSPTEVNYFSVAGPASLMNGAPQLGLATSSAFFGQGVLGGADFTATSDSTFPAISATGGDQRCTPGVISDSGGTDSLILARVTIMYLG